MPVPRRFDRRPPERDLTRINERIRVPEVRLIDDQGQQVGVMKTADALRFAQQRELDLVEVAADARPPVCRVLDYSKYKYEQAQKLKQARKHQQQITVREIKFRPKIAQHDYDTKKGHVERFLRHKDKVKVTIMFRGREQSRPELGFRLLQKLADDVTELGFVESQPKQDGRNMIMVIGPHKRKTDAMAAAKADRAERASRPSGRAGESAGAQAQPPASSGADDPSGPDQSSASARLSSAEPSAELSSAEPSAELSPARPLFAQSLSAQSLSGTQSAGSPSAGQSSAGQSSADAQPAAPRAAAASPGQGAAGRGAAGQGGLRETATGGPDAPPRPAGPRPAMPRPNAPRPTPASARPAAPKPSAPRATPGSSARPSPAGTPAPKPTAPRGTAAAPRPAAGPSGAPKPGPARRSGDGSVPSPRPIAADRAATAKEPGEADK